MTSSLDAGRMRQALQESTAGKLDRLDVFASIDSTNTYLLGQPGPGAGHFHVAMADQQTAGRGRHDRHWLSPPGAGLSLSLAYTFAALPGQLPALTLAIGVAVVAALRELDIPKIALKWPNDIVAVDGKLGGILTEVQSGEGAGATVVTGIGINVHLREPLDLGVDSAWAQQPTDLHSIQADLPPRETLAAAIIDHVFATFARFEKEGFATFAAEWRQHDWLLGREILVDTAEDQIAGVAAGVDDDGALLVDTSHGCERVISGTILLPELMDS